MPQNFILRIKNGERVAFDETMAVISEYFEYIPTRYSNGLGDDIIINEPGMNEGSCKIFYFARLYDLNADETLALFGDYYWKDVLENPEKRDHANIRSFITNGWKGIQYCGEALIRKAP